MQRPLAPLALSLVLIVPAIAADEPLDCQLYMTGNWVGAGEVATFGQIINVDNRLWLKDDGTFVSENKFQPAGKDWQEQNMEGNWSAEPGEEANECLVSLAIEGTLEGGGSYSSSSKSTYVKVDENTLTSMDFPMTRTPIIEEIDAPEAPKG